MAAPSLSPLVRAIVDRPLLIAVTLVIGLFTVDKVFPVNTASSDLLTPLVLASGWLLLSIIFIQRIVSLSAFWRGIVGATLLVMALLWWLAYNAQFVADNDAVISSVLILLTAIGFVGLGAVLSRALVMSTLVSTFLLLLSVRAAQALMPDTLSVVVVLAGLQFQMILILSLAFMPADPYDENACRLRAGDAMMSFVPFVFYAMITSTALLGMLAGIKNNEIWALSFRGAEPLAVTGFFVLPVVLIMPGLFWISQRLERAISIPISAARPPSAARPLQLMDDRLGKTVRALFSPSTSYAILAIAGIMCVVSMAGGMGPQMLYLFAFIGILTAIAGLSFFSLRVLIAIAVLLPLVVILALTLVTLVDLAPFQIVDRVLTIIQVSIPMLVLVQCFTDISLTSKYRRSVIEALVSRALGPYLLVSSSGAILSVISAGTGVWPAGVASAATNLCAIVITLILGPALLTVLASRYGKF